MLESCVSDDEGLPVRKVFITCHNIVAGVNAFLFVFTVIVHSLSPPSKEALEYKRITTAQFVTLFTVMFLWSSFCKFYADFGVDILYMEGFFNSFSINTGHAYCFCAFLFGLYGSLIIISYLYRLFLIADSNHIIRKPHMLLGLSGLTITLGSVFSALFFHIAYVTDFSDPGSPFLSLQPHETKLLLSRGAIWYPCTSPKGLLYIIYFGSLLIALIITVFFFSAEIVRQIYKKQRVSSNSTKRYHIHVLKSLFIQSCFTIFTMQLAPFIMFLRLTRGLTPCLVEVALVIMGCSFTVHTIIFLFFNQTLRRAFLKCLFLNRIKLEEISTPPLTNASSRSIPRSVVNYVQELISKFLYFFQSL